MRRGLSSCLCVLLTIAAGCADEGEGGYCSVMDDWDPQWAALEEDVLVLVNERRSEGANCGSQGQKAPVPALTMQEDLRCAARVHSQDMDARSFFDHVNPSGEEPWDRFDRAGYTEWTAAGENIAAGSPDAAGTMAQWMGSDGHCANIMSPDFTEIGVGYHPGGEFGHLWTQTFGRR